MDEHATFLEHKERLQAHAYRMLGRWSEAEDIVQEAYLRWSKAESVERPGAFLTRVVTHLCLDHLKSARHRREEYPGTWLPEPSDYSPGPESSLLERESLRFAFLRLLQELEPRERAAYLLREVLEVDYEELAQWLETSPQNCRQLVSRAKKRLKIEKARFEATEAKVSTLMQSFLKYTGSGERDSLLSLLREDIVLWSDGGGKARSAVQPIFGADKVSRFFLGIAKKNPDTHIQMLQLNGAPAIIADDGEFRWVLLLDIRDDEITQCYIVSNPDKLTHIPRTRPR